MKSIQLIAMLIILLFASDAKADLTGNQLHNICKDPDTSGACLGYVMGVVDVIQQSKGRFKSWATCLPTNSSRGQARDVVKNYLENNPSKRHFSSPALVAISLSKAFPCPKIGTPK